MVKRMTKGGSLVLGFRYDTPESSSMSWYTAKWDPRVRTWDLALVCIYLIGVLLCTASRWTRGVSSFSPITSI